MKVYLKLNENNIITDCVDYNPNITGYNEFELSSIPVGINDGWYKIENECLVEIVELNPTTIENKIKNAIDAYTEELITGGLL